MILQHGSLIRLQPDQILYRRYDLDLRVYMIIYGTVELRKGEVADSEQLQEDLSSNRVKFGEGVGRYTLGTFVGEEWIYYKKYVQRDETCMACEPTCVLEISVESFECMRQAFSSHGRNRDVTMLET